jgi:hypothetical protein
MREETFYVKSAKKGGFWKSVNYFLLTMGASSVVDITEVSVGNNIIIKFFIGDDISIEYPELAFIRNNEGRIIALEGKSDRLLIEKLQEPDELLNCLFHNLKELRLEPVYKDI